MRSRAAVLYRYGDPLVIEEVEIEAPRHRELLVELAASGVCHSDLSHSKGIHRDPLPTILGHEGAGTVVEVGPDVSDFEIGDHVVMTWKPSCGACRPCGRGRPHLCEGNGWLASGRMKDGTGRYSKSGREIFQFSGVSTFSQYSVVEDVCAVKVDRTLSLAQLSLVGCAVTTGVGAALNAARIRAGDAVAVIGCGGVGLSAIQGARIAQAGIVVAVDRSDEALDLARRLGATHVVNSGREDPRASILALTGGVDWCFEAVGRSETMQLAVDILARGAEAILIGVAPAGIRVDFEPFTVVRREQVIRGSYYGSADPRDSIVRFSGYVKEGRLDLATMVRERRLEGINDVFGEMESGVVGRNVIRF